MTIRLQTVGLVVRDLRKTLDFYRLLGFDIPGADDGADNVDFTTPAGLTLGFLTAEAAAHADPTFDVATPGAQLANLQFLFDTPAEVDATFERFVASGYAGHARPWDAPWGQRFARVKDPDGRIVNLYAPLDGARAGRA